MRSAYSDSVISGLLFRLVLHLMLIRSLSTDVVYTSNSYPVSLLRLSCDAGLFILQYSSLLVGGPSEIVTRSTPRLIIMDPSLLSFPGPSRYHHRQHQQQPHQSIAHDNQDLYPNPAHGVTAGHHDGAHQYSMNGPTGQGSSGSSLSPTQSHLHPQSYDLHYTNYPHAHGQDGGRGYGQQGVEDSKPSGREKHSGPMVRPHQELNDFLESFWSRQMDNVEMEEHEDEPETSTAAGGGGIGAAGVKGINVSLPLARIKKVMKSDEDVKVGLRRGEGRSAIALSLVYVETEGRELTPGP